MGIGVFLDSAQTFNHAVSMWRKRVPAYFYLTSDGAYPVPAPGTTQDTKEEVIAYWQDQAVFKDGLAQETCRDFDHTQFGIASAINAAETARLQDVNLYGEESKRLTVALEFHAGYLNGDSIPSWLCGGKVDLSTHPTWEIASNHYHNRLGIALPKTEKLILAKLRPTGAGLIVAWEALTDAETGNTTVHIASPAQQFRHGPQRAQVIFLDGQGILVQRPGKAGYLTWFGTDGKKHPDLDNSND